MSFLLILALGCAAWADDDDDDEHGGFSLRERHPGLQAAPAPPPKPAVPDPGYAAECGSCHVAYPARMLPARSWVAVMNGLSDHFGDDATVDDATRAAITAWLVENAAERTNPRLAARIPPSTTPLRISETGWFRGEHDEIPARMATGNPEVKTWAACGACHPDASKGSFGEHAVRIPGYGRFED